MSKRQIGVLERFAAGVARRAGSTYAFVGACGIVVAWAAAGPLFHYSNTWQLMINTTTTISTFLMVFLIQRSQNKESMALQLKLNELLASMEGASSRLVNVEDLSEHELEVLHRHYAKLASLAKAEGKITESHSIEEAEERHKEKKLVPRHARHARS